MLWTIRNIAMLVVAIALSAFVYISPLFAASVTYIGNGGSDGNPCSFSQPCSTFFGAFTKTDEGGEVICLSSTAATETGVGTGLSLTIDCNGVYQHTFAGFGAFQFNGGTVRLRNLTISGSLGGTPGIVVNGGSVIIENCIIENISGSGPAIDVEPPSGKIVDLVIINSRISHNGGTGVLLKPLSGGAVNATFDHVLIESNGGGGLRVDGTGGGPVKVAVTDSSISLNNSNGVNAVSGPSGNVRVNLTRDVIASNTLAGVQSNQSSGGNASVTVGQSTLASNGSAWSVIGGATLESYQNNQVTGATGTPPSPISFQ